MNAGIHILTVIAKSDPAIKHIHLIIAVTKSRHKTDRCNNKGIEQTSLDDAVLDLLYKHFYEDIINITQKLNDYRQEKIDSLGADFQTLKKQITANEIKVKNSVEAIAQGLSNPAMFERIEELKLERDHLEKNWMKLQRLKIQQ